MKMTNIVKKQFQYVHGDGFLNNGNYITPTEVCELLNQLSDDNKHLKNEVKEYKEAMKRMMMDMMIR